MKIIEVFQSGSTDGYRDTLTGNYHLTKQAAEVEAHAEHGSYGITGTKLAIRLDDGTLYLLASRDPIAIVGTDAYKKILRDKALSKLTEAERDALGFKP